MGMHQNIVLLIDIITVTEIVLNIGSFFFKQKMEVAKQINYSYCRSPVRDIFDNLYTCKWNVDGSGVKCPTNSKIEVVIVDDSEDSEECDTSNFRERHNLAIKIYNAKLKVTQEKYREYMDNYRLQENTLEKNVKVFELEMHLIDIAIPILL